MEVNFFFVEVWKSHNYFFTVEKHNTIKTVWVVIKHNNVQDLHKNNRFKINF